MVLLLHVFLSHIFFARAREHECNDHAYRVQEPGMKPEQTAGASATDYLVASKNCEIIALEAFLRMGRLVVAVSNLVHALQRERGAANLYLGAGGREHGDCLGQMEAGTDQQYDRFRAALEEMGTEVSGVQGGSRFFSRIAYVVHAFSELGELRHQVRSNQLSPEGASKVYSGLVHGLLSIVFEAAETAMDPSISRLLVAMFNFMQGKELAGQERAAAAAGFAMGQFDPSLKERLDHLDEAQQRCFEVFMEFAEAPARTEWQKVKDAPEQQELDRLRRLARARPDERAAEPAALNKGIDQRWFWIATGRIDAMKAVEDQLESRLHELCEEKLRDAREGLARQQTLIEDLLHQEHDPAQSFIVFCSAPGDVRAEFQQDSYHTDGVSPGLGRSIIDLVQAQSQRLQQMNDELTAARTALEERKLLDKAKLLLMKHRGMSEEQAYKMLRQTAMDQSRRLVDVARAMVAIGDVWTRTESN
ncbi:MAG: hypothetical protein CL583_05505 [Alteromonadaceae bacterium]|nr:hypothetical protein [Alteromonadaceae bacterium]